MEPWRRACRFYLPLWGPVWSTDGGRGHGIAIVPGHVFDGTKDKGMPMCSNALDYTASAPGHICGFAAMEPALVVVPMSHLRDDPMVAHILQKAREVATTTMPPEFRGGRDAQDNEFDADCSSGSESEHDETLASAASALRPEFEPRMKVQVIGGKHQDHHATSLEIDGDLAYIKWEWSGYKNCWKHKSQLRHMDEIRTTKRSKKKINYAE